MMNYQTLLALGIGTTLCSASAGAFNQIIERDSDKVRRPIEWNSCSLGFEVHLIRANMSVLLVSRSDTCSHP